MEENNVGSDSDSDTVADAQDYYEPISAVDTDSVNDDGNDEEEYYSTTGGHGLTNGHHMIAEGEDGISSISLNGEAEAKSESEEETETPELEIRTTSEEDERRRRSALMVENAARVMEAMRAISFPGTTPDWASDVTEDRWTDQLRRDKDAIHHIQAMNEHPSYDLVVEMQKSMGYGFASKSMLRTKTVKHVTFS